MVTNENFKKRLEKERIKRGKRCHFCGIYLKYGEFAHRIHYKRNIRQTLKGSGRGRNKRILDITLNPDTYILLCHDCHKEYDVKNFYSILY